MEFKASIKEWDDADRPREKLLAKGKQVLSDAELIAILIGSGNRNESAVDLAKRILNSAQSSLPELSKMSIAELMKFKGIGEAKAISIVAAMELGRRRRGAEVLERKKIGSSRDVFEIFQADMADSQYEEFWILLLNRANKIMKKVKISDGGVSGTVADPKRIFRAAMDSMASSIILCHNHPSGNITPSNADIALTKKISNAADYFDMVVLDHIIIGDGNFYSFADNGRMPV
jgi:DNA repair protein RadC